MDKLLKATAERAIRYLEGLGERSVAPLEESVTRLKELAGDLPDEPSDPADTLALLDEIGSPATIANAGGRYFGYVFGSSMPVATAANWLAGAWNQNAGIFKSSPVATMLEDITLDWLLDVLGLPQGSGVGFVTGTTMGNFAGLAAARHAILARMGWDVESQGLYNAPEITVVVGDEVHVSLLKALGLLGFGRERVVRVPVDGQGRMRADALPSLSDSTIVCIQAGNVNSGAFDPATEICAAAHEAGAWVHVDGAFGLWAAASPERKHLTAGVADADSWATDGHKWLNVPYDSGLVFCRDPNHLLGAMSPLSSAYITADQPHERMYYTPELSRRARGVEIWAVLHTLGRSGLADMIERMCQYASRFAGALSAEGYSILNEVLLNQVLVSFGDPEVTKRVIAGIQSDGTCWCSGTVWHGHTAMRISVSGWATTPDDVERSLEAMLRVAKECTR
jgi:glutamate/tyrosine decarboxylase-like PLP-dependent enzyme